MQSSLSGGVTVPSDAAVANILVTETNEVTTQAREQETGIGGVYKFALLPLGEFTAASFRAPGIEPATINIAETTGLNQVRAGEPASASPPNPDALTWHGITLYGAYDVGIGWVSHGLPQNPYNYEGSSLVNRNANHSRFLVEPDNLSQTGLGIRGKEQFAPGWSVFGEFNYMDFGRSDINFVAGPATVGAPDIVRTRLTMDTALVGVNYKFNWAHPVVAKY